MKVLGLFPSFGPDRIGGIETSARVAWQGIKDAAARGQSTDLNRLGCNPQSSFLFCYGSSKRWEGHDNDQYAVHVASKSKAVMAAWRQPWTARKILIWHLDLLKLLPFFRAPDAQVILFLHGIEAWRKQDWLTRLLLRRVNLFLTNSNYTWQRFLSLFPSFKHVPQRTIHLGVGTPVLESSSPPPSDCPPAVLMLGRLHKGEDYKGHRELIHTWSLVRKRLPDAELWIVGSGNLQAELERVAQESGLTNSIKFHGRVSEEEKQNLVRACRCLALPSRAEGFGLVYLEAMRLGRPCLVSTFDAGREVVDPPEAGLAVDPGNSRALADAVCRLLTPGQEWEQWSVQARRRYEQGFTASQFQQRLISALFGI